jgi:hypothetical protein
MFGRRPLLSREDLLLLFWSLVLGLAAAAAFGAYRAISASDEDTAGRLGEFGTALFWPGALIIAGIAAVVWLGWKANLD